MSSGMGGGVAAPACSGPGMGYRVEAGAGTQAAGLRVEPGPHRAAPSLFEGNGAA
jgi:hypothetical protein